MNPCNDNHLYNSEEQYIALTGTPYPAGDGEEFVYNDSGRSLSILPQYLSVLLRHCGSFQTINAHADNLCKIFRQHGGPDTIREGLVELQKTGFLRSKTDIIKEISASSKETESPPPISAVAWISCGRTRVLQRCMEGYIENNNKYCRKAACMVFDDSKTGEQQQAVCAMLGGLASATKAEIYLAGPDDKRRFVTDLVKECAEEGLPSEVLAFALFDEFGYGLPYGANYNALLLGTAGDMVMCTDDDAVYKFAEPAGKTDGLKLLSTFDPTDLVFYPDRNALLKECRFSETDIISCHEKLLGRSLSRCVAGTWPQKDILLDGAAPVLLKYLRNHHVTIAATATGVCGDSGFRSPSAILGLEGMARDIAMASKEAYLSAIQSRQVFRSAAAYTVSSGAYMMAGNMALDNRRLLPPFFPVRRNTEGVFAAVLRACFTGSLIGHLPYAVFHDPLEERKFQHEAIHDMSLRISEIVILLVQSFNRDTAADDPESKLHTLGTYLINIAGLGAPDFNEYIRIRWLPHVSRYICRLEELLAFYDKRPGYWAKDVFGYIEKMRQYVTGTSCIALSGTGERSGEKTIVTRYQHLVKSYGELLIHWPLIIEKTKKLRNEGKYLLRKM
ncbi:MAG: hypothetical protein JW881_21675 [Spirochaetales bacterium]|nr:hypothetical protein [Spirochaetales bacterium]